MQGLIGLLRLAEGRRGHSQRLPDDLKSIGIVELTRLGDVIAMLPVVRVLHGRFPAASIHLFVKQGYASFLGATDLPAQIRGVPGSRHAAPFAGLIRLLRASSLDLAVSMSPARRNALAVLASGAPFKVGYLSHRDSLTPFLHVTPVETFGFRAARERSYGRQNIIERGEMVLQALGVDEPADGKIVGLREEVIRHVRQQLRNQKRMPEGKYVVLHPFSGWEYRMWPQERFSRLARHVVANLGHEVVIAASAAEEPLLAGMRQELLAEARIRFFLSDDLLQTAVLMEGASLFVGNDSGPLHLAALLGVRSVGLFGPAEPEITGPRTEGLMSLYHHVDCSPCDQRRCIRPDDPCMGLISVDEVVAAVAKSLSSVETAPAHA